MRRLLFALAFLTFCWTGPAHAHPHVWIDANVTFVFEQKLLTGVRVEWSFDEIFSTLVIHEHDKNKNKKLEDAEIESVRREAFVATKEYSYFTHITVAGSKAATAEATAFKAEIVKGKVVYRFTLPLASPVDPSEKAVAVKAYDESFYVDIGLENDDPVRFAGMPPGLCFFDIGVEPSDLGAFGLTDIKKIQLLCPKK
jgi:ABC-type uncharacterized transport system substrate-binding protein